MENFTYKKPPMTFINKFPFTKESKEYVQLMDITPDDLLNDEELVEASLNFIKKLASKSHISIINFDITNRDSWKNYALINYFLYYIGESLLWSRFAEVMRRNIESKIGDSDIGNIIRITRNSFNWELEKIEQKVINRLIYDWKLKWYNYISVASTLMDESWKLINNYIDKGWVFLSGSKIKRLVAQKVRNDIFNKSNDRPDRIPNEVYQKIKDIKDMINTIKEKYEKSSISITSEVKREAYPPCINYLINKTKSGENLAHYERLVLVFFLLNIGFTVDEVVDLFKLQPDFNEEKAKYYIEHAAGKVGGRTKYKPYNCIKIQSFEGICKKNEDKNKWCNSSDPSKQIKNPINYYNKVIWRISDRISCPKCGKQISKYRVKKSIDKKCPFCKQYILNLIDK